MEAGQLSQTKELNYDDLVLLLKMLPVYKDKLVLLMDFFKSEKDFLKFLDLFAGTTLTVPSRQKVFHILFNIEVYRYYIQHSSSETVVADTVRYFHITQQRLNAILTRVGEANERELFEEEEDNEETFEC